MLVGIMSDSHGDAAATAQAVALLTRRGARKLFHCGDLCGRAVLDELAGHDCTFVWGNCDAPSPVLRRYVAALGLSWPRCPASAAVDGKTIAVYHGHEPAFAKASQEPGLDYIFYGHTHKCADHHENGCRFINPGALHRASVRTVALLDLETDALTFLRIDSGREIPHRPKSPSR
jgi:hypothetical protein